MAGERRVRSKSKLVKLLAVLPALWCWAAWHSRHAQVQKITPLRRSLLTIATDTTPESSAGGVAGEGQQVLAVR
jgi:hypothetical protein